MLWGYTNVGFRGDIILRFLIPQHVSSTAINVIVRNVMSRILRQSPRRGLRPLRERLNVDNVENTSPVSSDADADPDMPVAQMKNIFEQTPKVRPPVTTPRHHQAPLQKNVAVQKRWGKDATSVKNRLEKTILGGVTDDDEKQVSPSLRQLRMTPGRILKV